MCIFYQYLTDQMQQWWGLSAGLSWHVELLIETINTKKMVYECRSSEEGSGGVLGPHHFL